MARPDTVTEEDIQEYIDGRASPALRADVETFLAVRPHRKAEVQALIRQQDALRRLGTEILAAPIPERLQALCRRITRTRLPQCGRASCRERGGKYTRILVVA